MDETTKAPPASSDQSAQATPAEKGASSSVATGGSPVNKPSVSVPESTQSTPLAKPKVAAKPVVAVDDTPRPPATAKQAAKLLDLRTFAVLKGAQVPGTRQSIGELYYTARDDVATAFTFQRTELKKLGWKELPGARETGENPAATFTQQGFLVYVSVSSYGQGPGGESGWSSISLTNHGNILTSKLPVPKGAKPHYSMLTQAGYVTGAPLEETAQACKKMLLDAGWRSYGGHSSKHPVSNSHALEFKQNAVLLSANISNHSNQPGKTFIKYSTKMLTADIPAPPGSPDFRYTDSDKRMLFDTKDSPQTIATHYVKALGELGWKPTTDELIIDTKRRDAMMIFRDEAGDRIDLDMHMFNEVTRVELKHLTPADVAEIDRQIKALVEKKKREAIKSEAAAARRRKAKTFEFPIPKQAKKFVLDEDGDRLEIIMPGGSGRAALVVLRKYFKEAGWEEEEFDADGSSGTLTVKRGNSELDMSYINIDTEDEFELDVSCWDAYLKPVEAKAGGALSDGGEEPKPEK